ncbi:MAG: hypothetical protein GTN49_10050 [candidate division Zixibacteria bacterium]|nr:hypothetical protein [candidate division Zixibacteria bacterium]
MKGLRVLAAFAFSAASAWGTFKVISSFPCPGQRMYLPRGIDYDAGYIYHVKDSVYRIFKTTDAGSLVASWYCYVPGKTWQGIGASSGYFWIINQEYPLCAYRFTTNGSFVNYFQLPPYSTGKGITPDGNYVHVSTGKSPSYILSTYTTTGSFVKSVRAPISGCLDYDGTYFYFGASGRIVKWRSGLPSYIYIPRYYASGVSCQGAYFWFSDWAKSYVYKIGDAYTDIAPSSLGRVKALFR